MTSCLMLSDACAPLLLYWGLELRVRAISLGFVQGGRSGHPSRPRLGTLISP